MTMPKVLRYEMQWDEETHAPEVLAAYSGIQLTNARFDAFCEACDNPPAPTFVRQQ